MESQEAWLIIEWIAARSSAGRKHSANVGYAIATGAEAASWKNAKRSDVRSDLRGAEAHGTKRKTRDRFAPTWLGQAGVRDELTTCCAWWTRTSPPRAARPRGTGGSARLAPPSRPQTHGAPRSELRTVLVDLRTGL